MHPPSTRRELFDLEGKIAIVTGGTSGLGLMAARGFVEAGVTTYVIARNEARCSSIAEELSGVGDCRPLAADISRLSELDRVCDAIAHTHGHLDILVNNAGVMVEQPFETYSEEAWDTTLDLNLKAAFFLAQRLLSLLAKAARPEAPARIINIGSGHGLRVSPFNHFAYSASKAGLHHLTRVLARRLASENITVNAIAPGVFASNLTAHFSDERNARIRSALPLGRFGEDADIVGALTFLASRASAYVTGVILPVDGGWAGAA